MGIEPTTFGAVLMYCFQAENQRATIAPRLLFGKYRELWQIVHLIESWPGAPLRPFRLAAPVQQKQMHADLVGANPTSSVAKNIGVVC